MTEYIMDRQYDIAHGSFSQKRKEEVTRCRDCKYCKPFDAPYVKGFVFKCTRVSTPFWVDMYSFCWFAERKEVAE